MINKPTITKSTVAKRTAQRRNIWMLAIAASLSTALPSLAAIIDMGGVKFEDAIELRGNKLVFNGAGIR